MAACPNCNHEVLDIDVRCTNCGHATGATGAHRMLGQVMLGQYVLVDVLGQGGMSVVFKGKHNLTEQEVALKILPPELAAHSQVKSRFLEEAKALAALDHPNIVHLYNFGEQNGFFVLAMQFVKGETWERMILENKRLDWKTSCRIAVDVLRALEYAHANGVIHRDMKPSNVLVRALDGSATVMDFGIAKMTTSTRLTATGQTMGTVRYMSPEQVRGQEVDARTDLYSLGATLYESLVGDTPFDGNTHFEIMTKHLTEPPKAPSVHGIEVPQAVEDAILRSLAKKAEDRFETARDMRKILEAVLHAADPGLSQTQKVSRDQLTLPNKKPAAARKASPEKVASPIGSSSTATDLADELEPGISGTRRGKKKSPLLWIALGALLVGGAATAAVLVLNKSSKPAAALEVATVQKLAVKENVGSLYVGTDGDLTPNEVAQEYQQALTALRDLGSKRKPPVAIVDRTTQLFAVPQDALCDPGTYINKETPRDCATAQFVPSIGFQNEQRLFVVAAKSRLRETMRKAVAFSVCQHAELDKALPPQLAQEICAVTKEFAPSDAP